MFEKRSTAGMVLNWRGPLLAAAVFAAGFAILLLMAHQNQSNASDMGSSLREDPYGTSLLFDSYARAGYQVKRSQDEGSLAGQDAMKTTAFFIGGFSSAEWGAGKGRVKTGDKLRGRLENFLARGGRVVLIAPTGKLKSESQQWEVETKWNPKANESKPIWILPNPGLMPPGSERMYLGGDAPWLETDAGWTPLYSHAPDANSPPRVYMAIRKIGKGELIASSQESFLLNEVIKSRPNPVVLDFLAADRQVIWVDETLHGLHQDEGVLWLVHRYRLQAALVLFWTTLLVLLWSMSGDLLRRPSVGQNLQIMRYGEGTGIAARRLLQRSIGTHQVVAECWQQFSHRSPQDAQAIVEGQDTGPRLRAALALPPLAGYRQLSQLIAERRSSVRGLPRRHQDEPATSIASPQTLFEEKRNT